MAIDKIRNRNGNAYRARIVLSKGGRKSRCFDRKVDAEIWEAKVRTEARDVNKLQRRKMRFAELAVMFIENHAKPMMAYSSYHRYEGAIRNYLIPEFGNVWIDEISRMQVVEYRSAVDRFDLSASTKYFVFTAFKTVMRKALEWDLLDKSPAEGVKPPRKGMNRMEYWKATEVSQFLDGNRLNPHLPLYLLALNTGMRIGELMGLKWDCVDLENGFIMIRRVYCQKTKGVKETTKTRRARQIGMNPVLRSLLVGLQLKSRTEYVLEGKGYRSSGHHFSRLLEGACEKAGVRPLKFHDLRHTFATQFVMNDGSIHALSGTLGHTSTTMTSKYAHYGPEHARKAAQVVSFDVPEQANVLRFGQEKRKNLDQSGQELARKH